jgi:carboxymethylenebutenolidase
MQAPLLLGVAGADFTPLAVFGQVGGALAAAGVPHRMVVCDGAPHSFFDRTVAEHRVACEDAWRQMLDFVGVPAPA